MHSYQITQKNPHTILSGLLNSLQQGHIGNTENIGNTWTTIKSNIQKHTKSIQRAYKNIVALTTKTNQQAYCKVINKDIDKKSKYLFTYRERKKKKYCLQVAEMGFERWLMVIVASSDRAS